MKILVSGATGFIGSSVCEALSREGHELVAITRNSIRARSLIPAPHQAIEWDFSESIPNNLKSLEDIEAVIHLAGESILEKKWNSEVKNRLYHSRVTSTQRLISLLKSHCKTFPKIFITASAIGFYGDRGAEYLDESSSPGNDFLSKLCQDWENALFDQCQEQTRKIALRIGIVLGKGGGALEKMLHPFSLGFGGTLGDGSQWMSWIHLTDLVGIILECLQNEEYRGPINCSSPHPVTNREFTHCLAKHLNTFAKIPVPETALKFAFGEGSMALLSSQRIKPLKLLQANYQFKYPILDSALSMILGESYSQGFSELYKKCWLPLSIEEVFKFFSEASNLEKITPPWLNFHILSLPSDGLKQGATIVYRLKIHGVPLIWQTEISSWTPPKEFTDTQKKGPYQTWKHTHRFSELGGGTLMEDRVLYRLPMGYLGRLFGGAYVKKDVSQIFSYRNEKIYDLLTQEPRESK